MNWIRDRGITTKLLVSFALVSGLTAGLGVFSLRKLDAVRQSARDMESIRLPGTQLVAAMSAQKGNFRLSEVQDLLASSPGQRKWYEGELENATTALTASRAEYKRLRVSPDESALLAEFETAWAEYLVVHDSLQTMLAEGHGADATSLSRTRAQETFSRAGEKLQALLDLTTKKATAESLASEKHFVTARFTILVTAVACVILAVALSLLLAATIRRPIRSIAAVVARMARGDLSQTVKVSGMDEIGKMGTALNQAIAGIRSALSVEMVQWDEMGRQRTEIGRASSTLASASEDLSERSAQLSQTAETTAGQVTAISGASTQVSGSVSAIAAGADEMSRAIGEVATSAAEAARVAAQAVAVVERTTMTISKLGESSRQISSVTKVISGIAQQTNLLALNATIEAARAGEAGKGFSVVASEVKELASATAKATEEIGRQVHGIQSDSNEAVAAVQEIAQIILRISEIQTSIAGAVEEQTATSSEMGRSLADAARGSSDIAQNIARVADASRGITDGALQGQGAANSLARLAGELRLLVGTEQMAA